MAPRASSPSASRRSSARPRVEPEIVRGAHAAARRHHQRAGRDAPAAAPAARAAASSRARGHDLRSRAPGGPRRGVDPRPVRTRSSARPSPTRRGSVCVPATPGIMPSPVSGSAKRASARGDAADRRAAPSPCRRRRRGRARRRRSPRARARSRPHTSRRQRTARATTGDGALPNSRRSPPVENARPAAPQHHHAHAGIGVDAPPARHTGRRASRRSYAFRHSGRSSVIDRDGAAPLAPQRRERPHACHVDLPAEHRDARPWCRRTSSGDARSGSGATTIRSAGRPRADDRGPARAAHPLRRS